MWVANELLPTSTTQSGRAKLNSTNEAISDNQTNLAIRWVQV